MLRIRVIHGGAVLLSKDRLEQVKEIFSVCFPELAGYAEKIPALLGDPFAHGYSSSLLVAERTGGRVDAFALLMHFPAAHCCFLDFIASRPGVRGSGVGGAVYEATREFAQRLGAKGLYLEVEPDDPSLYPDTKAREVNRKRIQFYEQYGARIIDGTEYHAPVGEPPTTAYLIYDPLGQEAPLSRDEARCAVEMILSRRFGHVADPEYIRRLVDSFRDDPVRFMPVRRRAESAPRAAVNTARLEQPFSLVLTPKHEIHHVRERGYFERPIRHEAIRETLQETGLFHHRETARTRGETYPRRA